MRKIALGLSCGLLPLLGCMSLEPVDPGAVEQVAAADAGAEATTTSDACTACMASADRCATEWQACGDTPKCSGFFQCGAAQGCYADGKNLYDCLAPCGAAAGIFSQSDPAVMPFLGAYACARSKCASECGS